ncbi:tellurite resistance TerB family protein [Lysobacter silvisoli]|uniref:Tellurite resistance TerB family protein n=1 Tax=Lysobacter silvisoli TaxID=2293254 RepID=A0A371K5W3_9GAMM|nr:tellurite resistance TerB family protein [Lysobacter silvisoli]RDZ29331.1 tellurite resistance TerB family protein [Lysobacter silvisoli]
MKTQGFLDQLLKTAQNSLGNGGLDSLLGGSKPPARYEAKQAKQEEKRGLLNADFGKGALAGGALGLLLGNKKFRKMGGKLALYGGVAAVGVLAYKAYGDYRRQQDGSNAPEPQTVDRLPPPQAELHNQAILKALVAAAKADGHIDEREREVIEGEFVRIDNDAGLRQWLHTELEKPLDPAEVARAATTPEMASEMYLASLLAADEQSFMERAYLDELARQLKIDDALKAKLEAQLREAQGG